jgi:hypothetical protein
MEGHLGEINILIFKYDMLASGGKDRVIRIWKACPRWEAIRTLKVRICFFLF